MLYTMAEFAYNKIVSLSVAEARDRNRGLLDFEIVLASRGPQAVKSIVEKFSKSQQLSEFAIAKGWPPGEVLNDVLGNADAIFVEQPPLPRSMELVQNPELSVQPFTPKPATPLTITIMSYIPREKQSVFHDLMEAGMDAGHALMQTIDRQQATEILRQTIWRKFPEQAKAEGLPLMSELEGNENKQAIMQDMKQEIASTNNDRNMASSARAFLSGPEYVKWKELFDSGTPPDEAMISVLSGQYKRSLAGVAYLKTNNKDALIMTQSEVEMRLQEMGTKPPVQKPLQIVNLNAPGVTTSELERKALQEKIRYLDAEAQMDLARLEVGDAGEGAELLRDNIDKSDSTIKSLAEIEQTFGKQARKLAEQGSGELGIDPKMFLIGAAAFVGIALFA